MHNLKNLTREELEKLTEAYALSWLAHDGCWFLASEEKYGIDTAIELDKKAWERFAPVEAKRIMKVFNFEAGGGLKTLEKVLNHRMYSLINEQSFEWKDDNTLVFKMINCRVQNARKQKGLEPFPCKQVGIVEFTNFAKAVDERVQIKCISCPPDSVKDYHCAWEFKI
jgi:hypothetical protein